MIRSITRRPVGRPAYEGGELVVCTYELTKEQKAFVTARAKELGVSRAEFVRQLIDKMIHHRSAVK